MRGVSKVLRRCSKKNKRKEMRANLVSESASSHNEANTLEWYEKQDEEEI